MLRSDLFTDVERSVLNEFAKNSPFKVLVEDHDQFAFTPQLMFFKHIPGMFVTGIRDDERIGMIALNPDVDMFNNLYTVFHEITHATRETFECKRGVGNITCFDMNPEYRKEELVANFGADQLLNLFNAKTDHNQAFIDDYHKLYSKTLNELDIEWAKNEANKAVQYILKNWIPGFAEQRKAA